MATGEKVQEMLRNGAGHQKGKAFFASSVEIKKKI